MNKANLKYIMPLPVKRTKVLFMTAGWGIFIFGGLRYGKITWKYNRYEVWDINSFEIVG